MNVDASNKAGGDWQQAIEQMCAGRANPEAARWMIDLVEEHSLILKCEEAYAALYHLWDCMVNNSNFAYTQIDMKGFHALFGEECIDAVTDKLVETFGISANQVTAASRIDAMRRGNFGIIMPPRQTFRQRVWSAIEGWFS